MTLRPRVGVEFDVPDPAAAPWPDYASAVVEFVLQGIHVVLTPLDGARQPEVGDSSVLPTMLRPPVWVLTAGDPYPEALSAEQNAARNTALRRELAVAGILHDPALGRAEDGSVWELSVALREVDRATALAFAAAHGQLAIYEITDTIACIDVASASVVTRRRFTLRSDEAGAASLIGPTGWHGGWT